MVQSPLESLITQLSDAKLKTIETGVVEPALFPDAILGNEATPGISSVAAELGIGNYSGSTVPNYSQNDSTAEESIGNQVAQVNNFVNRADFTTTQDGKISVAPQGAVNTAQNASDAVKQMAMSSINNQAAAQSNTITQESANVAQPSSTATTNTSTNTASDTTKKRTTEMIKYIDPSLHIDPSEDLSNKLSESTQSTQQAGVNLTYNALGESLFPDTSAPVFRVPRNPLLPPEYQEVLSYDAILYTNGFLRTQIGRFIGVEQFIGTNYQQTVYGYLVGVGLNYVLIQNDVLVITLIDIYSIKNVSIYYSVEPLEI